MIQSFRVKEGKEREKFMSEGNQRLIATMRQKLEEAIKASEDTIVLPVRRKARVSGRILPSTSMYEIEEAGPSVYIIDGMSQHGFLHLVDIPALIQGDVEHLYTQHLGTYDRDPQAAAISKIHMNIAEKDIHMDRLFFDQDTLDYMVEQRILFRSNEG